ncbi:hypothetical protein ACFQZZ_23640 [Nocardia sp. GCM10030253]|uniref:hypothetical protein n=1 Tax=Nocardia sp. GCM10030253 TaxID=3273404 RepID=UPI00362D8C7F
MSGRDVAVEEVQNAGLIVKKSDKSYELTTAGRDLGGALQSVWDWSQRWATLVMPTTDDSE